MDFRFNFQIDDSSDLSDEELITKNIPVSVPLCPNKAFSMKEALSNWLSEEECDVKAVSVGDDNYYILSTSEVEDSRSDRIAGVYEGGLKVWECSLDLTRFISDEAIELKNKNVLELGCGIGLPGMAAARRNCNKLVFQDFNDYVLTNSTAPSVCCNHAMRQRKVLSNTITRSEIYKVSSEFKNLQFISGDWSNCAFTDQADVILTAETIYDVDSYAKLHDLLRRSLALSGVAYVASKAFYFGVGGGTHDWLRFCQSRGVFNAEIVHCVDAPLKRFIIKMTR